MTAVVWRRGGPGVSMVRPGVYETPGGTFRIERLGRREGLRAGWYVYRWTDTPTGFRYRIEPGRHATLAAAVTATYHPEQPS